MQGLCMEAQPQCLMADWNLNKRLDSNTPACIMAVMRDLEQDQAMVGSAR